MRSEIRDTFDVADPETFWDEIIFDRQVQERIYLELGCLSAEVQEQTGDKQQGLKRTFHFEQPLAAPGPLKKVFGDRQALTEVGRFDPETRRFTFEMRPDGALGRKIEIRGELWVEPAGPGQVTRCCTIEANVNIFGVGGLAGRFVKKSNEDIYAQRTQIVRRIIEEKGLS